VSREHLWIRAETRPTERRAPVVPADAAALVARGWRVTVEEAPTRVFALEEYRDAGCEVAATGSWPDAPDDAVILGIKELPESPRALRHTHVFFAHAFKGQAGAAEVLARFAEGGGELLDVEYLTVDGRRVVAFGYWAGYVGAGLGVRAARGQLGPVAPGTRADFDATLAGLERPLRALVIGARGRSGQGACDALRVAGVGPTRWDVSHTLHLDRAALLEHDLLVNCVASAAPGEPFVRTEDLERPGRRLTTVADVTCDVTSDHNRIPVNTAVTTWAEPVRVVGGDGGSLSVIAIDNLPSLLPREASIDFSSQLVRHLDDLPGRQGAWAAARADFDAALAFSPDATGG
jgi:saccharopine dehydrogenase (NAD+, L-lysine-forming)